MDTRIKVVLTPVLYNRAPTGQISVGEDKREFTLDSTSSFEFLVNSPANSKLVLTVEHYGKTDKDTQGDRDTAIIVDSIQLNGIDSQRFAWQGIYTPTYPVHYPNKIPKLSPHTYLGWNGVWTLELTVPIFTWIHKVEGLGWIYD